MGESACGFEVKFFAEKRSAVEGGDLFEEEKKRMKMQELTVEVGLIFEEVVSSECHLSPEDMSRVSKEGAKKNVDAPQLVRKLKESSPLLVRCNAKVVDVNKKADVGYNHPRDSVQPVVGIDRALLTKNDLGVLNVSRATAKEVVAVTDKDLAYSSNSNPFYPCKKVSRTQYVEMSECGSVAGPSGPKDPLEVWKEMKLNGFLSSSHSQKVVTVPPVKIRVRKTKADIMKKKLEQARIEQAKKEQVDRFTKIAAPSGLLNELNPGIINHMRNSKQVHSILKALVKPEGHDARTKSKKELGFGQRTHCENGLGNNLAHGRMTIGHQSIDDDSYNMARGKDADLESRVGTEIGNQSSFTFPNSKDEDFRFSSTKDSAGER